MGDVVVETEGLKSIDGRMVCARCLGKEVTGWVAGAGPVVLITCASPACTPKGKPWLAGVAFVEPKKKATRRRPA